MTPLRQRMLDAMLQRGFAKRTQASYVEAIYRMAKYYRRDPATYSAEEVQAYLLHMVKDCHLSYSTMNQAACAARFLFESVLGKGRSVFQIPMAKVPAKQPELLAREEIARLFASCVSLLHRTMLQTVYATGLRVSEVCALHVQDIDSAPDRMCVRVECGKGGKTRYTLLSPTLLAQLRRYAQAYHPRDWLFGSGGGTKSLYIETAQRAYQGARSRAGITKVGGIHTLRHYPEFRNMPSSDGGARAGVAISSIVRGLYSAYSMTSERLEKGEQLVIGSIAPAPPGLRFNFV